MNVDGFNPQLVFVNEIKKNPCGINTNGKGGAHKLNGNSVSLFLPHKFKVISLMGIAINIKE